jgi:hypothetical protein
MTDYVGAVCGTEKRAGSSSPPLTTADLSTMSGANVAWLLADAADVCLTGYQRTMTYIELGSGEHDLAIERILKAVMSSAMTIPVAILGTLSHWLDQYDGSPEEPQLRTTLADIWAQQSEPISLQTR